MTSDAPVSKYAGAAANAVWTAEWGAAAFGAYRHLEASHDGSVSLNLIVTIACFFFGCVMTSRVLRRLPALQPAEEKPPVIESWPKRIVGWFGLFVWCAVGVLWNLAISRALMDAATAGRLGIVLVMIPFSLIGWFLLTVLFVSIGVGFDSLLNRVKVAKNHHHEKG